MKVVQIIGGILVGLSLLYIEIAVFAADPWQLLNPFVQFRIAWYWIQFPLTWVGMALIAISMYRRK